MNTGVKYQTGIFAGQPGEMAFEFARLINNWTKQLTVFTNGTSEIEANHTGNNWPSSILKSWKLQYSGDPAHTNGVLDERYLLMEAERRDNKALYAKLPFEQQHCARHSGKAGLSADGYRTHSNG